MSSQPDLKVIISGGGTGGHIFPAIAIAQAIENKVPGTEFLFVGAEGRMEMEKVPAAGYKIEGLWISGLQRKSITQNLLFPIKVISSLRRAGNIISQFKPDLAVGVGGYASGPLLYMAAQKKIPCIIHEQNSYAGITNKLLASKVNTVCVAYDGMEKFFPKEKIYKTGNPVRKDIGTFVQKSLDAYHFFGLDPYRKTLLVIGGSLGARTINESLKVKLDLIKNSGYQLLWQTGKSFTEEGKKLESDSVKIFPFIQRMELAYAISDLVISRAGAISIAELALLGKPVILVPSPNVAEDHQTKNAMALVSMNAAVLIKDIDAKDVLVIRALELLKDEDKKDDLKKNIVHFAAPDAADIIAEKALSLLRK